MYSGRDLPKGGFPHSDIRGSTIARISPRLFAACHVLHRLLAPRHPPNALITLSSRHHRPHAGPNRALRETVQCTCRTHTLTLKTTQLFPDKLVKEHTSPADTKHRRACLLEVVPTGRMVEAMHPVGLISTLTPTSN